MNGRKGKRLEPQGTMTLTDLLAHAVDTVVAARAERETPDVSTPRARAVARIATIAVATAQKPEATPTKDTAGTDAYVTLRDGLTVPVAALALLLDLERREFQIRRTDDDRVLALPERALTAADVAGLTRWRTHLLALLDYTPSIH